MLYLLRRKIILCFGCCFFLFHSFGQIVELNQPDHDEKPYHFGINLGYNKSHFSFSYNPRFLQYDSILSVESINSAGINLAWLVSFRLGDHFSLRTHPLDLTFSEKAFLYSEKYTGHPTVATEKKVQAILLSFPVDMEFSSERINNFKVYVIGGAKFDYDLASNTGAQKAEELIKLKKTDLSLDIGFGFHFYFPYFVLSPELKLSSGITNVHNRDVNLRYSNVLDKINSRMISFSFTVE